MLVSPSTANAVFGKVNRFLPKSRFTQEYDYNNNV